MDASSNDPNVTRLIELAKEALQIQARLVAIGLELGRATLAGDAGAQEAGQEYVDAVSREAEEYWKQVRELGVDYATELAALGGRLATKALAEVTGKGSADPATDGSGEEDTDGSADEGGPRPFTNPSRAVAAPAKKAAKKTAAKKTAAKKTAAKKTAAKKTAAKKTAATKTAATKTAPDPAVADGGGPRPFTNPSRGARSGGDEGGPRPFTNPSATAAADATGDGPGEEDGPRTPFTNPSRDAQPRDVALSMNGSLGETATVAVAVRNVQSRRRKVTLTPVDLKTRNGRVVAAALTADPDSLTLGPGEEGTLTLSLVLDPAVFAAGRRYKGTATVSGGESATVTVTVDVGA